MKIIFRNFLKHLRIIDLEHAYIVMGENITPCLYEYVSELDKIEYKDGAYHTYCVEIKLIVNNFIQYWMRVLDNSIKKADELKTTITKDELLDVVEKSMVIHQGKQIDFGKQYVPIETRWEKQIYTEIEQKYALFMETILQMKGKVQRFDTQELVSNFTNNLLEISLQRETALFECTHTYIALVLADHVKQIRSSLEEIRSRIRTNLKDRQEDRKDLLNGWLDELYEKNKERTLSSRQQGHERSKDLAEIDSVIAKIRDKIEYYQQHTPVLRLEEEMRYWQLRLRDYNLIEDTLLKLKKEKENLDKQSKIYNSFKCTELPGSKLTAWQNIGENLKRKREFINGKYLDSARALLTFFAIRGVNSILYKDNVGRYMLDEYGHQIYIFDHGKKIYHLDCTGNFKSIKELDKYYYDSNGRYVIDKDGTKIYQCAPCASAFKLGDDDLLHKSSEDCGHSEKLGKSCRKELKLNNIELLPRVDPVDIKGALSREVTEYLWNNFAHILPTKALCDVDETRPYNPIHSLAHNILFQKYRWTPSEIKEQHNRADEYRKFILKNRKDKAVAASLAWKAKQFKRRKPEESDDSQEKYIYGAHIAGYDFIKSLDNFN